MSEVKHREEAINIKVADALANLGLDADAETIQAKGRPDVLVNLSGIKLALEGREAASKTSLSKDAKARVTDGLADIALALEYPARLYKSKTPLLGQEIQAATFSGAIFYFAHSSIQENRFENSTISDVAAIIRNAFSLILQNDVVRAQVDLVESAIAAAVETASSTNLFFREATVRARLMEALAIADDDIESVDGEEEE